MVDSRLRFDPPSLFHCFAKISSPSAEDALQVTFKLPEEFQDQEILLKQIKQFCYPCSIDYDGVQYSTFVLTDLESKFRFGFCRYPPHAKHCLCIISYLPWFETFYAVLDKVSQFSLENDVSMLKFLHTLNEQPIPAPGSRLNLKLISNEEEQVFKFDIPDTTKLPTIPDNRNLTEYFAKVTPENMVNLFISMLFERRIIVTSERLSVLTAVIHGSVALLYPMQWQHIYVPILPPHLIDYCCAPMPFLLGIHSSMMAKVEQMPMNEVVIFNADTNEISIPEEDADIFPSKIASKLKKKLQRTDRALDDYVSSQFLNALAELIGGYKDALKFTETENGGKIVFDDEAFKSSRSDMKVFLEYILTLQQFHQFVAGRLEMLNDGVGFVDIFEQAVLKHNQDSSNETKYTLWKEKMKKGGGAFKKSVEGKYGHLKGRASEIEMKDFKRKLKHKYKTVKKDVKGAMKSKENPQIEVTTTNIQRNNSLPLKQKNKVNMAKDLRHSMYSSLPKRNIPKPGKTPPPRPPRPPSEIIRRLSQKESSSVELPRKQFLDINACGGAYTKSHSEANISDLISVNSTVSSLNDDSSTTSISDNNVNSQNFMDMPDSETLSREIITGSYANPAFLDPLDHVFNVSNEETPLEHRPIVEQPQLEKTPSIQEKKDSVEGLSNQSNSPLRPKDLPESNKPKRDTSLKRSPPVASRPFKNPPLRPAPPNPDKGKTPPSRPPRPSLTDTVIPSNATKVTQKETSENPFDDQFVISSHENVHNQGVERSVQLPSSPFYMPSTDLLGLDQSLFHETMQSLSDDTRQLISRSSSFDSQGDTVSDILDFSSSPTIDVNIAFLEDSNASQSKGGLQRSPVLSNNPFLEPVNYPGTSSNNTIDPFASILEDAKKDLKLKR